MNNGDEIITDNLTGLMWDQNGYRAGTARTWAQALSDCSGSSLGGYTDWRLPNINELESLMNEDQINSVEWLNEQGFIDIQIGVYWSSVHGH